MHIIGFAAMARQNRGHLALDRLQFVIGRGAREIGKDPPVRQLLFASGKHNPEHTWAGVSGGSRLSDADDITGSQRDDHCRSSVARVPRAAQQDEEALSVARERHEALMATV